LRKGGKNYFKDFFEIKGELYFRKLEKNSYWMSYCLIQIIWYWHRRWYTCCFDNYKVLEREDDIYANSLITIAQRLENEKQQTTIERFK
jgi:hypothetical protein